MPHPTYLPPLEIDAASLSAEEIAAYFRSHPEECKRLLHFSYDKRSSPNTFIEERGGSFRVGWYDKAYQHLIQYVPQLMSEIPALSVPAHNVA